MLKNQLLQQALAKVTSHIDRKDDFDKIVSAGTQVMYDKNIFAQLTKNLAQSKTPVEDTAKGIVGVLGILTQRSKGTVPRDVLVQAGFALLLDALDFEEQAGLLKVDNNVLDEATKAFMEAIMPTVSLSGNRVSGILSQLKDVAGDPQKLAAFQQAVEAS